MSEQSMKGDIVDRLRGRYPCGPRLPNGEPEFGWREFDPDTLAHLLKKPSGIMGEAAVEIESLRAMLCRANAVLQEYEDSGFSDPGRFIDAVRDALGRRYPQ